MLKTYGGETGIRTLGTLTRTPVFKTGALNQLDHLSKTRFIISMPNNYVNTFLKFFLFFLFFNNLHLLLLIFHFQDPLLNHALLHL